MHTIGHTLAPWHWEGDTLVGPDREAVASVTILTAHAANARLLIAAPALLEAAIELLVAAGTRHPELLPYFATPAGDRLQAAVDLAIRRDD